MIDLLQTYFGMAVRSNTGNLQDMTRATWAALMHKVQHEDPAKQHRFCPPGGDSWCGWQVEQAGGEQYTARDTLPYAVFEVIKPIWLQLTDKEPAGEVCAWCHPKPQRGLEWYAVGDLPQDQVCWGRCGEALCCPHLSSFQQWPCLLFVSAGGHGHGAWCFRVLNIGRARQAAHQCGR